MDNRVSTGISMAIILSIAVLISGFLWWSNYKESKIERQAVTQIATPTVTPAQNQTPPVPINDETADWKTYKNDKYGFELKYPNKWIVPKELENPGLGIRYEHAISLGGNPDMPFGEFNEGGIAIKIYKESDLLYTDDISNVSDNYSNCIQNVSIGQGNYEAKEIYANNSECFKETYFYSIQKGEYIYNIIPFPKGGIGYVGYDGKVKTKDNLPEFDKILSTFKFLK